MVYTDVAGTLVAAGGLERVGLGSSSVRRRLNVQEDFDLVEMLRRSQPLQRRRKSGEGAYLHWAQSIDAKKERRWNPGEWYSSCCAKPSRLW